MAVLLRTGVLAAYLFGSASEAGTKRHAAQQRHQPRPKVSIVRELACSSGEAGAVSLSIRLWIRNSAQDSPGRLDKPSRRNDTASRKSGGKCHLKANANLSLFSRDCLEFIAPPFEGLRTPTQASLGI